MNICNQIKQISLLNYKYVLFDIPKLQQIYVITHKNMSCKIKYKVEIIIKCFDYCSIIDTVYSIIKNLLR